MIQSSGYLVLESLLLESYCSNLACKSNVGTACSAEKQRAVVWHSAQALQASNLVTWDMSDSAAPSNPQALSFQAICPTPVKLPSQNRKLENFRLQFICDRDQLGYFYVCLLFILSSLSCVFWVSCLLTFPALSLPSRWSCQQKARVRKITFV